MQNSGYRQKNESISVSRFIGEDSKKSKTFHPNFDSKVYNNTNTKIRANSAGFQ